MRQGNRERGNDSTSRPGSKEPVKNTSSSPKDYWDSIADDVANGYRRGSRGRGIYNEDQERDDNRRGDEVA